METDDEGAIQVIPVIDLTADTTDEDSPRRRIRNKHHNASHCTTHRQSPPLTNRRAQKGQVTSHLVGGTGKSGVMQQPPHRCQRCGQRCSGGAAMGRPQDSAETSGPNGPQTGSSAMFGSLFNNEEIKALLVRAVEISPAFKTLFYAEYRKKKAAADTQVIR